MKQEMDQRIQIVCDKEMKQAVEGLAKHMGVSTSNMGRRVFAYMLATTINEQYLKHVPESKGRDEGLNVVIQRAVKWYLNKHS